MTSAEEPTDPVEPETDADAKPTPGRTRESMPAWGTMLAALPVVYVLSVGPVALIAEKAGLSSRPFQAFYAPLIWLHKHTALKQPLEWYIELWGVK